MLDPIITFTTVWNTGETGDINTLFSRGRRLFDAMQKGKENIPI